MKIYVVVADQGGAHEQDSCYSLWSSQKLACDEISRLTHADISPGSYRGKWHVVVAELDAASNFAIES